MKKATGRAGPVALKYAWNGVFSVPAAYPGAMRDQ